MDLSQGIPQSPRFLPKEKRREEKRREEKRREEKRREEKKRLSSLLESLEEKRRDSVIERFRFKTKGLLLMSLSGAE